MDTTLRSKAMEKESLTSKFLFNGCNVSLILVQYMLVSVQCMGEAFSQPTLFHFIFHFHDTFEDVFGRGGGGITIELGSWEVFPAFSKNGYALSFKDTGLNM